MVKLEKIVIMLRLELSEIKELLEHAVHLKKNNGSENDIKAIENKLAKEIWDKRESVLRQSATLAFVLHSIFYGTLEHNPDLLPKMLPLFELLCNDDISSWNNVTTWELIR